VPLGRAPACRESNIGAVVLLLVSEEAAFAEPYKIRILWHDGAAVPEAPLVSPIAQQR
jgi:hypothetical protein